jgi:glutamyl-tRNA reductase
MSLYALGLNHATAPLAVREMIAFQTDMLGAALRDLIGSPKVKEAAILSTCNRTEVYFDSIEPAPVMDWLEGFHRVSRESLAPYLYTLQQSKAVAHAFRVASGLDSMVLGEPQILGQMKHAVKAAEAAGSLGLVLHRLFQHTFAVAKEVRSNTNIGSVSISMAAAAVKLAERIFPSLGEMRVLLIGAGEMIDLVATHFAAKKPRSITVANRTLERGAQLAARLAADAITLNELPERLSDFDIVITSTGSSLPILGKGLLERAIRARRRAPMFIVDLAVPRDVEPEAARLDDLFLYTIDDIARMVKDNLQVRSEAVREAEAVIAEQVQRFLRWLDGRKVVPTIAALQRHHSDLRTAELERARRMLTDGTPPVRVLEELAYALTNRSLQLPTQALGQANAAERGELLALLHRVYDLPDADASVAAG